MPWLAASIMIQIACAVHCIRGGGNRMWLMVIIFLSLPGCAAYAIFEILPHYAGRREVRAAREAAARRLDPDREVRAAREAVETADTASNRTWLGDALAEQGEWREAAAHYREALAKTPGEDRGGKVKLARACLEAGEAAEARRILEAIPPSASPSENDRAALLLARSFDQLGETGQALALYAEVGERMAGAEAQCRHAALLIASGGAGDAVPVLEEVERRARRIDAMERRARADMYEWAARTLAELRGP
jgi:hypothetical protein